MTAEDRIAKLTQKLEWAKGIRSDAKQPTVALQLAQALIEQLQGALAIEREQLDRFGAVETAH